MHIIYIYIHRQIHGSLQTPFYRGSHWILVRSQKTSSQCWWKPWNQPLVWTAGVCEFSRWHHYQGGTTYFSSTTIDLDLGFILAYSKWCCIPFKSMIFITISNYNYILHHHSHELPSFDPNSPPVGQEVLCAAGPRWRRGTRDQATQGRGAEGGS